jgi:hypothetical protein
VYISIADLLLVTFVLVDDWYQRKGVHWLGRTVEGAFDLLQRRWPLGGAYPGPYGHRTLYTHYRQDCWRDFPSSLASVFQY